MDVQVDALSVLYPEMVREYMSNRQVISYGNRTLAIMGTIKNEAGEPIFGATFRIDALKKSAKSTAKGNFEFKSLLNGEYPMVVERAGYATQTILVSVVKGETLKLNLVLHATENLLRVA